jgi:hypothetical protein
MSGICECGCGQKTKRIMHTARDRNHIKGQFLRFVHGHNSHNLSSHPSFKGNSIGYSGGHHRVRSVRGNPDHCIRCGSQGEREYEWANLSGRYHDPNDYAPMCIPCHKLFDYGRAPRKSACRLGHPYTEENTQFNGSGFRQCRLCTYLRQRVRKGHMGRKWSDDTIRRLAGNGAMWWTPRKKSA